MCWQKLDRKSKKLTFNFFIANVDSEQKAGIETVDRMGVTLSSMQKKLDQVSRNFYLQSEMDKQHGDSNIYDY